MCWIFNDGQAIGQVIQRRIERFLKQLEADALGHRFQRPVLFDDAPVGPVAGQRRLGPLEIFGGERNAGVDALPGGSVQVGRFLFEPFG